MSLFLSDQAVSAPGSQYLPLLFELIAVLVNSIPITTPKSIKEEPYRF